MKHLINATALVAAFAVMPFAASAGERYATPPPIALSPDLSSSWTLQIKPGRSLKGKRWNSRRKQKSASKKRKMRVVSKPRRVKKKRTAAATRRSGVVTSSVNARPTLRGSSSSAGFDPALLPATVSYDGGKPGSIVVNTIERRLYLILPGGKARRYAIGVGKPGFEWSGTHKISRKAQWPDWRPPKEMIERERAKGREIPAFMAGGPKNPLGARAMYLGSTIYRIHGTNQNWSIGKAVSSGCIRMRNQDVMELYERVPVGARVKVI